MLRTQIMQLEKRRSRRFHTAIVAAMFCLGVTEVSFGQQLSDQLGQEPIDGLVVAAREKGNAVRGAISFAEQRLGCANCHAAGNDQMLGPDLTRLTKETTDAYLVESLLFPSKSIKDGYQTTTIETDDGSTISGRLVAETETGVTLRRNDEQRRLVTVDKETIEARGADTISAMPQGLVNELRDRQEFLDVTRYLMQLRDYSDAPDQRGVRAKLGGGVLPVEQQALVDMSENQCANCHDVDKYMVGVADVLSAKTSPRLGDVGRRISPDYLVRFIADPHGTKPGTSMPNALQALTPANREAAAKAIAAFLISQTDEQFAHQPLDKSRFEAGNELFHEIGCVACHSPRDESGTEILKDSVPLGDLEQKYSLDSLVAFLEDPLAVRPSGRMPHVPLTHFEAVDLANYLLQGVSDKIEVSLKVDEKQIQEGRRFFSEAGCANCHALGEGQTAVPSLERVAILGSDAGCLSDQAGAWPKFDLDNGERQRLVTLLSNEPSALAPKEQVAVAMTALRCVQCHTRDELGGVTQERDLYFHTSDPNLGPQGRIPPSLTGVGSKLKPTWLRQVLVSGRAIRPYVKTRMPQYGVDNVESLIEALISVDDEADLERAAIKDRKKFREAGHELAGNQGLNCIACHTYQLKPAETMSAVDLTEMAERLQRDWFDAYMLAPQKQNPNTVMPSFWPGGVSIRGEILDGDSQAQLDALWEYLSEGRQARTPRGLIREPIELLATDETVMLRRSYPGIGKRGIGVGYPSNLNLVFDAEQMRVAMLWSGKFADPGGVWRSQGHGTVRPLGRQILRFESGPDLDKWDDRWIVDEGRPPRHRFKGYRLDEYQRPIFRYLFDEVSVEDYVKDVLLDDNEDNSAVLRRKLTLETSIPRSDLAWKLGTGKSIEELDNLRFQIDGQLIVKLPEGSSAEISRSEEASQLWMKLDLDAGKQSFTVEYDW